MNLFPYARGNCNGGRVRDDENIEINDMIVRASVPLNKVVVGVASYGRTFKMEQAGCDWAMCKFTGSARKSLAAKGLCTDAAGYTSNAEINEILQNKRVTKTWTVNSNFIVYNDTGWVAWMGDEFKKKREGIYAWYNFAGTSDWAVDLQSFSE
ncbi:uncharacterized protein B0I36DRAFT_374133 [Microdochium trichocladiopsis]|uniref:Chitinase n=1 Tax=Microdochium trichocladiopsis TaxID=1682393 RepID=A0A9P8Y6Z3_9PEZI|nr:uncharacterized protein B0I36DRAFT_374133 [Microdochium trichocladiopsis]KAH7031107.1 hypothetical protein B0I36DRAFT_374133 [Microdochium trichocladiopsis]